MLPRPKSYRRQFLTGRLPHQVKSEPWRTRWSWRKITIRLSPEASTEVSISVDPERIIRQLVWKPIPLIRCSRPWRRWAARLCANTLDRRVGFSGGLCRSRGQRHGALGKTEEITSRGLGEEIPYAPPDSCQRHQAFG